MSEELDAQSRDALTKAADAYEAFVTARNAMNAARPAIDATPAERALYDERYRADHAAEREHWETAIGLAQCARSILGASPPAKPAPADGMREALEIADAAIREYVRYLDGGEMRGSYDGKPERNQLRKAGYVTRAALSTAQGEGA